MSDPITADCLSGLAGIRHGFFTRQGGVSDGLYDSLNCGLGSKDDRDRVEANRDRVGRVLAVPGSRLLTCHQVHSADAVVVREPWAKGIQPKADGLVTDVPGLALGALAADCAPVLFADPEARVVGAAHAGWKGALTGVLEATIQAMCSIGAKHSRIRAALGPCIGASAYEVGEEFEARFLSADQSNSRFFRRPGPGARPRFDLPGYVLDRLAASNIDTVESATRCTYSDEVQFYSYRRATHRGETDYGRQVSAIVLL